MKPIRNIIFDLGGVLLDIDFRLTENAFTALGVTDFSTFFNQYHSNHLFSKLETGVDVDQFYDDFRAATGLKATDEAIQTAWNALLLDFRAKSLAIFPALQQQYRLFLLSNTNEIHVQHFLQRYHQQFPTAVPFDALFEQAYYSNRIGLRKPDAAAFEWVLDQHQLVADETLFIDDSINNIDAAQKLGLQTVHLLPGMYIENLGL